MTKRQQADLKLGLGVVTALLGVGLLVFGLLIERPRYEQFKTEGLEVKAWVTGKRIETRRSRRSRSTNNWVEVAYASGDARPFELEPKAAPQTGNPIDRIAFGYLGKRGPTDAKSALNVSHELYESVNPGSSLAVVFLAGEPDDAIEAARLRRYSPWPIASAGLLFAAFGAGLCAVGLRGRRQG